MKTFSRSLIALVSAASCAAPAMAEDFSLTDVQLLYTTGARADAVNGTGTRNEKLTTIRFEHFGTHSLGDNYFSLDLFRGDQIGGPGAGSGGGDAVNNWGAACLGAERYGDDDEIISNRQTLRRHRRTQDGHQR